MYAGFFFFLFFVFLLLYFFGGVVGEGGKVHYSGILFVCIGNMDKIEQTIRCG